MSCPYGKDVNCHDGPRLHATEWAQISEKLRRLPSHTFYKDTSTKKPESQLFQHPIQTHIMM